MNDLDSHSAQLGKQKSNPEQVRSYLLHLLSDGDFHSGEALASQFNLSRSAISNHIKALNELGVSIFSIKGRGYRLADHLELLSKTRIVTLLMDSQKYAGQYSHNIDGLVCVENVVGSTNDVVKKKASNEKSTASGFCCLAEAQTAGRGRRGRKWISPYGASLYLSMLWHFDGGYQAMTGLSLMVGVVLRQTLCEFGIDTCKLKWPNDLYYKQQKLAGILIEVEGQLDSGASAIIGIGLNIKLPQQTSGIDQAFTDLSSICEENYNKLTGRNALAAKLIANLWMALSIFERQGLSPFLQDWQDADLYLNKRIKLIAGNIETVGISRGVNASGALLLEIVDTTSSGSLTRVESFHGGEISVRPI